MLPRMVATWLAALTLLATTLATTPAFADARFEDRAGVLYVTNVEPPVPKLPTSRGARRAREVAPPRAAEAYRHFIQQAAALYILAPELVGNVALALAAYNAGVEAVARHGGIPPVCEDPGVRRKILEILGGVATADGAETLHRYQTEDGVVVYSNVPLNRSTGPGRATADRLR